MQFKSLPQLLDFFKDEKTGIQFLEQMIWKGNPVCPHCQSVKPYVTNRGYKCSEVKCKKKFTVKTKTIFHSSKIPVRIWMAALYLSMAHKKGVTSTQLATDLGITQKTAWYVLQRLRLWFENLIPESLDRNNIIECDETHVGGKEKNRHWGKRRSKTNPELSNDGNRYNKKKVVLGIIERGGRVILKHVPGAKAYNLIPLIKRYVPLGTRLMSDESTAYLSLRYKYNHEYINHSVKHWVQRDTYTNTIECFWSHLKRGVLGVYHHVSEKHLQRYLYEFAARYNSRGMDFTTRLVNFLPHCFGRLTYKALTSVHG